jgi:hypothetical protein
MLSARLINNFIIVPLNEQWVEIIIKDDAAGNQPEDINNMRHRDWLATLLLLLFLLLSTYLEYLL